jgi:3-(3-hydroxy-phenyl)propionate hydroxylase
MKTNLDALIVGAGPVGLSMAASLSNQRLRFRIIDSAADRVDESRAIGIQARTMEIFEMSGIVDEFLALGHQLHGITIYGENGSKVGHLNFDKIPSHYPFLLALAQSETERILGDNLRRYNVEIERRTTLISFEQSEVNVCAQVALPDGEQQEVHADWLLGCDGAHSRVREVLNPQFAGKTYDLRFLLGDVRVESSLSEDEAHIFGRAEGLLGFFPLGKSLYRLVADDPPERFNSEIPPTLEEWQELADARSGVRMRLADLGWSSYFRVKSRMVERLRRGRIFVLGDAAHIHSPALAQGMNTGIQDAWNLGWKLALVQRSLAKPDLLDSFEEERMPVEHGVLMMTDLTQNMIAARRRANRVLRDALLPLLSGIKAFQSKAARTISETGIEYRNSRIVEDHRLPGGPHAGDRAPSAIVYANKEKLSTTALFGRDHVLLALAGSNGEPAYYKAIKQTFELVRERYRNLIKPYLILRNEEPSVQNGIDLLIDLEGQIAERYSDAAALYLVRPDGYVAFRSHAASHHLLEAYLGKHFIVA